MRPPAIAGALGDDLVQVQSLERAVEGAEDDALDDRADEGLPLSASSAATRWIVPRIKGRPHDPAVLERIAELVRIERVEPRLESAVPGLRGLGLEPGEVARAASTGSIATRSRSSWRAKCRPAASSRRVIMLTRYSAIRTGMVRDAALRRRCPVRRIRT